MEKAKPMRQAMPTVAGWIDDLRAAFGAAMIDAAIRAGIDGQPTFHARENGHEVGTPMPHDPARAISATELVAAGRHGTGKTHPPAKGTRRA